ncbi:MAG: hypothetical protein JW795_09830 [Chitinivibrionales bacterium]|nr:hypothetical protein [Chitinivibrionales bacterium]
MKQHYEHIVPLGFQRSTKKIFDEIEQVSAEMIRKGWLLHDTCIEEGLGNIHLFFQKEIPDEQR